MKTVFALTSGRSGTKFLASLLHRNARDCVVFHEPYFDLGNPTLFGRPIYDHAAGDLEPIRRQLRRKRDRIRRCAPRAYIETSHAFLKSYWDLAPEFFPDLLLIHLSRDPLAVARSEAVREAWIDRWRLPFRRYRGGDGKKYFRWSLTGLEQIFRHFSGMELTRFQWYLIQWIEIENRAMSFLERFGKQSACFMLDCPRDLNDPSRLQALMDFLGLPLKRPFPVIAGTRNRNPGGPTRVGAAEEEECRQVLARLPGEYLQIFAREPYSGREWSRRLRR